MAILDINSSLFDHIQALGQGLQRHAWPTIFDLLLGILVIRITIRIVRFVLKLTHMQTGLRYVLTSIIETLLWVCLIVILLKEAGLDGVILFFTGSIAAIGIAMAAGGGTLVTDIVAAIFLARDSDFNVGDEVIVGEPLAQGVIVRMDARRIRLRDKDGILHVIPNSLVERKEWIVVNRRGAPGAISKATKTAKRLGAAALDKRPNFRAKKPGAGNNAQ